MTKDKIYFECFNGFRSFRDISRGALKPLLRSSKAALLYTVNRNWKSIIGKEFFDCAEVEKVVMLPEERTAKLYVTSFNSSVSFYINNNKTYILDKINNFFGYRAVLDMLLREIPRPTRSAEKKYVADIESLKKFEEINAVKDTALRGKLRELAAVFYRREAR
jgi:hypothetical protein